MGNSGNSKRLYFFGLQNHYRWWLQPWNWEMLAPWKKSYDQPRQHKKKQKRYSANQGPSSQSYGFSSSHVRKWELDRKESWALKNWCFKLWCWRRLLRAPWTTRRSNQSVLKEISPEHSLEGLMLKLKLQYFGHLMWRADSVEKILMLGKIEGDDRGLNGWMASLTQWTWVWVNSGSWWWTGRPAVCSPWGLKESDTTEWLNWTDDYILGKKLILVLVIG